MSLQHPVTSRALLKELFSATGGGPLQDMGWRDTQDLHDLTHLIHLEGRGEGGRGGREGGREGGGSEIKVTERSEKDTCTIIYVYTSGLIWEVCTQPVSDPVRWCLHCSYQHGG